VRRILHRSAASLPLHATFTITEYLQSHTAQQVRLQVKASHFVIPPGTFPRFQHQLSSEDGFRMWRHGVAVCRYKPVEGVARVIVETLIEVDPTWQYVVPIIVCKQQRECELFTSLHSHFNLA
jgi:hypothetical protein